MAVLALDISKRIIYSVVKLATYELASYKIEYIIRHKSYACGIWGILIRHGVEYTKENHELLVEIIQSRLVGSDDIEYEWTEEQYTNFVLFDPKLLSKDSYYTSK
jgi:hypothetical protein